MCKFCDAIRDGCYAQMDEGHINLGDLGKLTVDLTVYPKDDVFGDDHPLLQYGVNHNEGEIYLYNRSIEIFYCPFCGQKLESE